MADHRRSDFYVVFYHESLHTWIKTIVNKIAISNSSSLILGLHALRSYLKLICEYELHSVPNKKVSGAKDHGKNYIKVRPSLVRHLFCVIVYSGHFYHGFLRTERFQMLRWRYAKCLTWQKCMSFSKFSNLEAKNVINFKLCHQRDKRSKPK